MPIIGEAIVRIVGDAAPFQRDVNQLAAGLSKVGTGISAAGRVLTAGITLPIVALGAAAIKASIDFESAFAGVRKTVDATEPEFAKLAEGFRNMAKEIPASAVELSKIGEIAGQLGIEKSGILEFTRVVADLGETTNLAGDQAANALARIANIMGTSQQQFDNLGSTIVALGNAGASTESEIVEFGLRIAGAGKVAGLTEANILAIGSAMASVGVEAEAGGTAVQKVLLGMTEAVATGNKHLAVFAETAGLTAKQFTDAWKADPAQAFVQFVEGLGRAGDDAFRILDDLDLKDQRLIRSFLSIASAGGLLTEQLALSNEAFAENSALTEEAAKRYATTAAQLEIVRNKFNDVLITLGDALKPVLLNVLKAAIPVLETFTKIVEAFAKLPGPVQTVIVAFLGLLAALGPILIIVGSLISSIGAIAGAAAALGISLGAVAAIAGIVIGAIAAIVALGVAIRNLFFHFDELTTKAKALSLIILGVFTGGLGLLALLISRNWDAIKTTFTDAFASIGGAIARFFTETIPNLFSTGITAIGDFFRNIDWVAFSQNVLAALIIAFSPVKFILIGARIVQGLITGVTQGAPAFVGLVGRLGSSALSAMGRAVSTGISAVVGFFSRLPGQVGRVLSGLPGQLQRLGASALSAMARGVSGAAGAVISFFSGLPGRIVRALGNLGGLLVGAGRALMSGLFSGIVAGAQAVYNYVAGIARRIANLKGPLDKDRRLLIPAGEAIMQGLNESIRGQFGTLQTTVGQIAGIIGGSIPTGRFPTEIAARATSTPSVPSGIVQNIQVYEAVDGQSTVEAVAMRLGRMVNT